MATSRTIRRYVLSYVDSAGRQIEHEDFVGTGLQARRKLLAADLPVRMQREPLIYGGVAKRDPYQ